MTDGAEFKALKTEKSRILDALPEKRRQLSQLSRDVHADQARLEEINRELERAKSGTVVVSEHAALRYVQRVIGVPWEDMVDKVLPPADAAAILKAGIKNGRVPASSGTHTLVLQDGVVVTVVTNQQQEH